MISTFSKSRTHREISNVSAASDYRSPIPVDIVLLLPSFRSACLIFSPVTRYVYTGRHWTFWKIYALLAAPMWKTLFCLTVTVHHLRYIMKVITDLWISWSLMLVKKYNLGRVRRRRINCLIYLKKIESTIISFWSSTTWYELFLLTSVVLEEDCGVGTTGLHFMWQIEWQT